MRVTFGNWKYIVKNLWFILPFAAAPALLLALTMDYSAVHEVSLAFFTGAPRVDFYTFFRAWSIVRTDGLWGGIFSVLAYFACVICASVVLVLVEKHMRIGKRTLSGAGKQTAHLLLPVAGFTLLLLALYELWAALLSAVLFAAGALHATGAVYAIYLIAVFAFVFALVYVITVFYLLLPCKQITGFRVYDAFLYAYRLMLGVRGKLLLSLLISAFGSVFLITGVCFLPYPAFYAVSVILFAFLFLSFNVRMLVAYFETDKLDREDELKTYREF